MADIDADVLYMHLRGRKDEEDVRGHRVHMPLWPHRRRPQASAVPGERELDGLGRRVQGIERFRGRDEDVGPRCGCAGYRLTRHRRARDDCAIAQPDDAAAAVHEHRASIRRHDRCGVDLAKVRR